MSASMFASTIPSELLGFCLDAMASGRRPSMFIPSSAKVLWHEWCCSTDMPRLPLGRLQGCPQRAASEA
eukprot:2371068-Alexandrium_andersonii.AAC.1